MNIKTYALLHIADGKKNTTNFSVMAKNNTFDTYIKNASNLAVSLNRHGISFSLITNQRDNIVSRIKELGLPALDIVQHAFTLEIPGDVNFYSAHYKLDVYKFFAQQPNDSYLALLDLDMIAINPPPKLFVDAINNRVPILYDISNQVIPAYGQDKILEDLRKINPEINICKWYGGEFISGTSGFFKILIDEIDYIYPIYCSIYKNLHHQGDEMITSVALINLSLKNINWIDAGEIKAVVRFWSARIKHKQVDLKSAFDCFILHLPSDKNFLAQKLNVENKNGIIVQYVFHVFIKYINRCFFLTMNKIK